MISPRNPYKKAIIRSFYQILYLHFILILNEDLYNIGFTTITKDSIKLIPSFC